MKRGRPIGSKDTIPRKMKSVISMTPEEHITVKPQVDEQVAPAETAVKALSLNDVPVHNNEEISINYIHEGRIWDQNTTHINNAFSFQVAMDIIRNDKDQEPQNVNKCRHRNNWLKWKESIKTELRSLAKREVFGLIVQTPTNIQLVGYRWVFVRKRNENNEIVRYKARLVAQGFSQRSEIDYEETYSPVMDAIIFRYLISLAVLEGLDMRLMDVVRTYLYGSLDANIYIYIYI